MKISLVEHLRGIMSKTSWKINHMTNEYFRRTGSNHLRQIYITFKRQHFQVYLYDTHFNIVNDI